MGTRSDFTPNIEDSSDWHVRLVELAPGEFHAIGHLHLSGSNSRTQAIVAAKLEVGAQLALEGEGLAETLARTFPASYLNHALYDTAASAARVALSLIASELKVSRITLPPTIDAEIAAGQKQLDEDAIIGELEGFVLELDIPVKGTNVPEYATEGDAGADLRCKEGFILWPFERQLVGTGVSVAIPEGFVGYIKPRSGLAHKHGIQILGGVIDSGYRGEIKVIMHNTAAQGQVTFAKGDRIAQLVIQSVVRANFIPVETLPEAVRGEGGFGSTGHN